MESIKIVSLEQALAIIAGIDPRDLIFWIGAGIDRRNPTCLPLGDSLRSEVLNYSIGNKFSDSIDTEWKRTYEKLAILLSRRVWLSEFQRLETIIDCIQEFEDNLLVKESSVIKGLSCFEDVEPSHNHFVLAHYLLKGASVVTTNYENCLQKAYACITKNHQALSISYEDPESSVYVFSDKCHSSGEVHYIHGIASEPKKIGISLTSIKKGVGEEFPKWFNEWVRDGKTIVYLGYSGSDSLDVTPLITNCKKGEKATAIYVKHTENMIVSPSPDTDITLNQRILLKPFGKKIFCECNTKDFIDQLGIAVEISPPRVDPICTQNWLEAFKKKATPYGEKLYFTLTARILFELNIQARNIIHANDFNHIAVDEVVKDWFINYYYFRAAQLLGDKALMREYAERYVGEKLPHILLSKKKISKLRNSSMALDYYTATGIRINALILHQKPSKVIINSSTSADQKSLVQWAPTSQYNRYLTGTIMLISLLPFISSLIIKTRKIELQNLIDSMMKILECGYEGVVSVNQINIANRAVGLARNLLNIDNFAQNQALIDQAMQDYANTTHMHGVSTTMIFSVYSFCQDYQRTKNPFSKECAIRDLLYAAKIVSITNDRTLFLRLILAKFYSTYVLHAHIPFKIFRSEVIFDDELYDK